MNIKINIVVLFLFMTTLSSSAQGIRMSFTEMTSADKTRFVNALVQLKSDGLIDDMANFHNEYFSSTSDCCNSTNNTPIHFNFWYNASNQGFRLFNADVFLAWHRRFLLEFERALKSIDPTINLPYWDWTTYRSNQTSGSGGLWTSDFLGQFNNNANWTLNGQRINRNLGGNGTLPVDVTNNSNVGENVNALLQNETSWSRFSYLFEGDPSRNVNSIHARPHSWVGGIMGQGGSPGDPAFFLHHAMIDKIWQEWIEDRGFTSGNNLHGKTSMPRYDGTHSVNNTTLPSVDPDTMNNSDEIGVFYADASTNSVSLDNYTVTNANLTPEVFRYQGTIEVGENFIVPSGTVVAFDAPNDSSGNTRIILSEGFHAEEGSTVLICNSYDNISCYNFVNVSRQSTSSTKTSSPVTEEEEEVTEEKKEEKLSIYPNPFNETATVAFYLENPSEVSVVLMNLKGRVVSVLESARQRTAGAHKINITGNNLRRGIYLVRLITSSHTETKRLVFNGW